MHEIYGFPVAPAPEVRRAAFAAFVKRALQHAKLDRGLTVNEVAELAGIGHNTLYMWSRGQWIEYPKGETIEKFCDALDIPAAAAFAILWPGKGTRPVEPIPFDGDPDFSALLRKLRDPNTPQAELYHIRETIKALAARPAKPPGNSGRRSTG